MRVFGLLTLSGIVIGCVVAGAATPLPPTPVPSPDPSSPPVMIEDAIQVVPVGGSLEQAVTRGGTIVLAKATYQVTPPLRLAPNTTLIGNGALIQARGNAAAGQQPAAKALIEAHVATIMGVRLDCRGQTDAGILSFGRIRLLDADIRGYRRKAVNCTHGGSRTDFLLVDGLYAESDHVDPTRPGSALQYDGSKPLEFGVVHNVKVGNQKGGDSPAVLMKAAQFELLVGVDLDGNNRGRIVMGEGAGEFIGRQVRNLYCRKAGNGIEFMPDPQAAQKGRNPYPKRMDVVIER